MQTDEFPVAFPRAVINGRLDSAGTVYKNAELYVRIYQTLLDEHFPAFKDEFDPHTLGKIGFLGGIHIPARVITWYGVRPRQDSDESVILLPSSEQRFPDMEDNAAFLRGASRRTWSSSAEGFKDADTVKSLAWADVGSSLKDIVEQGRLNESKNRMLLMERVIAISSSAYGDYFTTNAATTPYPYIALENLREFALRKINRLILLSVYSDELIAKGNAEEIRIGEHVAFNVVYPPEVLAKLDTEAAGAAKQGEDLSRKHSYVTAEPTAHALLQAINSLTQLGVSQIESSPLTDWYAAQFGHPMFFVDSQARTRLDELLPYLYRTFLDEYKTLAEVNFPTLKKDFRRYATLPIRALVAIDEGWFGTTPVTLAAFPVKILEVRQDSISVNQAMLTSVEEIQQMNAKSKTDSGVKDTVVRSISSSRVMTPFKAYMPTGKPSELPQIDRRFCILRSLVYDAIEGDVDAAFNNLGRSNANVQVD